MTRQTRRVLLSLLSLTTLGTATASAQRVAYMAAYDGHSLEAIDLESGEALSGPAYSRFTDLSVDPTAPVVWLALPGIKFLCGVSLVFQPDRCRSLKERPGAVLATNNGLYVGAWGTNEVLQMNRSGVVLDRVSVGFDVTEMAYTPYGFLLFVAGEQGQFRVLGLQSGLSLWDGEDLAGPIRGMAHERVGNTSHHRLYLATPAGVHTLVVENGTITNSTFTALSGDVVGIAASKGFVGPPLYTAHASNLLVDRNRNMGANSSQALACQPNGPVAVGPIGQKVMVATTDGVVLLHRNFSAWWGTWHSVDGVVQTGQPILDIETAYDPVPMTPSPFQLAFEHWAGSPTTAQTVQLRNDSSEFVDGLAPRLEGAFAGNFQILSDSCNRATLSPGESCSVTVRCVPGASNDGGMSASKPKPGGFGQTFTVAGTYDAELVLPVRALTAPDRVPLTCKPYQPTFQTAPQSCQGYCGGYGDGCWCDSACSGYGDCCSDKAEVCGD